MCYSNPPLPYFTLLCTNKQTRVLHTYFKQTAENSNKHDDVHAKHMNSVKNQTSAANYKRSKLQHLTQMKFHSLLYYYIYLLYYYIEASGIYEVQSKSFEPNLVEQKIDG